MIRNNDIVKALGYVALYAAYVEESVDSVMERLSLVKTVTEKERKLPTSIKIDWCVKELISLNSDGNLDQLVSLLKNTKESLKQRNDVIHGRIYSGDDRSDNLKSGRSGVPDRDVTADELYDLAEELFNLQAAVPNIDYFASVRAIMEKANA